MNKIKSVRKGFSSSKDGIRRIRRPSDILLNSLNLSSVNHRIIIRCCVEGSMLASRKKLWSTPLEVVDRAIDLLEINSSDTVVDIGAGDGRFMVRCVERTEASKVIGVEIDEERGNEAAAKIVDAGLEDRCDLIIGNALDQDYAASGGTAFFLYLIPRGLRIVLPILQAIPRRIRVVTYISPFPDEVKPTT